MNFYLGTAICVTIPVANSEENLTTAINANANTIRDDERRGTCLKLKDCVKNVP